MKQITAQELIDTNTEISMMLEAKATYIPIEKDKYSTYNDESYVAYNKMMRGKAIGMVSIALKRHIRIVETGNVRNSAIGHKDNLKLINKLMPHYDTIKELFQFVNDKIYAGQSFTDDDFELFWRKAYNIIKNARDFSSASQSANAESII